MKYGIKYFFIIAVFLLILSACEHPVALGSRLSLAGPEVAIVLPTPDRSLDETDPVVRTVFNVGGTVRDELKVKLLTVTLDYWDAETDVLTRMGREWKWEKQWMSRESEENPWRPYTEASYNPAEADPRFPPNPPSWEMKWEKNKYNVTWNLPITMNRMEQGDYFITVSAWNSAGRHDFQSTAKLKIKFDSLAPTVRIINPLLLAGAGSLSFPLPPSWEEYVYDPFNFPEETSLNLMYYTNSFNDLSYRLDYTISPPAEFSFEITNEHDLDEYGEEKTAYYSWQWAGKEGEFPPLRGIFTDRPGAVGEAIDSYAKTGGRIELSDTVKKALPLSEVTPMQMVTRVKDVIGIEEYKSKGWFLYLPDSDKPYPFIDFAHRVHKDSSPPADAAELASVLRGSTNFNNVAYDDDGVKAVKWTLYELKDDSLEVQRTVIEKTVALEGNKKELWSFTSEKGFGVGRFKIIVAVQDIYGTWGDEFHGYFTIFSNTTPTVKTPLDSPDNLLATFWGDKDGNITIAGKAQIEDYDDCDGIHHDIIVDGVAIAWIKPGPDLENNFRYLDKNDPLWDGAHGSTDAYGNKLWKPAGPTFVPATAGNMSENAQEEWAFSQAIKYWDLLELEENLGIGMEKDGKIPFIDQQFRIRVETKGGLNVNPGSSVYAFVTRGDVTPPVLKFTEVVVKRGNELKVRDLTVNPDEVLPVIAMGDQVMIKGTYYDDSIKQWAGLGPNRHEDYLTGFKLNWTGEVAAHNFEFTTTTLFSLDDDDDPDNPSGGGRWETPWYTFSAHNRNPVIQLTAGLTDVGNRRGTESMVLLVETLEPILARVSSEIPNGYYGDFTPGVSYIDIFLEFNKPISFNDPASWPEGQPPPPLSYNNAPHLLLNNGGEAFYLPPEYYLPLEEQEMYRNKIVFRYFINGQPDLSLNTASADKGGGDAAAMDPDSNGILNATSIVWGSFPATRWVSKDGIEAVFDPDSQSRFDPANDYSLAVQKQIVIDKIAPTIKEVTTSAVPGRYGLTSQINIDVAFDESVQVAGANMATTYLTLTGGNLQTATPVATAVYQGVKGSTSINFLYIVQGNQDTSEQSIKDLGVSAMNSPAVVTDLAGNRAVNWALTAVTFNGVIIDTVPPSAPSIGGNVENNRSYYSLNGTDFFITGIVNENHKAEYNINYPTASGWAAYTGTVTNGQTNPIALAQNGTFTIAARQWDEAVPPNCSPVSTEVGPVRIDRGWILQRITSPQPDGAYSAEAADEGKRVITIDMEFRIPVTLAGAYNVANLPPENVASVTLNTTGGAGPSPTIAALTSAPTSSRKWTFTYTIPLGAKTAPSYLDVTALNLDSLIINDQWATQVNGPNGWLKLSELSPDQRLNGQKKMTILAGRPHVENISGGNILTNQGGDIRLETTSTGAQLKLTFDRDIFRGPTMEKLIIRQISDGYRIPLVLNKTQLDEYFINRDDIGFPAGAMSWRALGSAIYEQGYNGATESGANHLVSDTSVKYVLKFAIDPDNDTTVTTVDGTYAMTAVQEAFRKAETLSFAANDARVSASGRVLTIRLESDGTPLPVKGARYEWVFPNGFVRDILGTVNGGVGTGSETNPNGNDSDLSHNLAATTVASAARVLFYRDRADPPVIRVDKGSDIPDFGADASSVYRQARQPATTKVRINSRTPNAQIQYWRRWTRDPVFALLQVGDYDRVWDYGSWRGFPNLHNSAVMRPQSGTAGYTAPLGIYQSTWEYFGPQIWNDMPDNWSAVDIGNAGKGYLAEIGNEYYTDGGMIFHLRARAEAPSVGISDFSYEAAYRSVFVYINQPSLNANNSRWISVSENTNLHRLYGSPTQFTSNLDRVWIRGSNTLNGNPTAAGFPLSRDQTQSRKAKLLTPMYIAPQTLTFWPGEPFEENYTITQEVAKIYSDMMLTEANILKQTDYGSNQAKWRDGQAQWYWITWAINVPAYIDIFYGELPNNAGDAYQTPRTNLRNLLGEVASYRQNYPVFPGRTTVYEARPGTVTPTFLTTYEDSFPAHMGTAYTPPPKND